MDTGERTPMTVNQAAQTLLDMSTPQEEETVAVEEQSTESEVEQPEAELTEEEVVEGETEEDVGEQPGQAQDLHVVRVQGEEIEVPYSELIAGYSRHADYQKKTTELADARRTFSGEREETLQLRAQYAEVLNQLVPMVENQLGPEPDYDAMTPEVAQRTFIERQKAKENLAAVKQQQTEEQHAFQAEQQRRMHEYLTDQKSRLEVAIPNLSEIKDDLVSYGIEIGFTEQELGSIADHRMMVVLNKARELDRAVQSKPKLKQTRNVAKTAKPGARDSVPQRTRRAAAARDQLRKTGRVQDAAKALLAASEE